MNKPVFVLTLAMLFCAVSANAKELVNLTRDLNGTTIKYEYTSGRSYEVKITEPGISYRYLTGSKPEKWWGPFPYQAYEVEKEVFMLSWFETGYGDYVTLLVNFNNRLIYGSAILRGEEVHFYGAKLIDVNRPDKIH